MVAILKGRVCSIFEEEGIGRVAFLKGIIFYYVANLKVGTFGEWRFLKLSYFTK